MISKSVLIKLIFFILFILASLPFFWPVPDVAISFSEPDNGQPDLIVKVSSWHSNYYIQSVRILPNPENPYETFYPIDLYNRGPIKHAWKFLEIGSPPKLSV